MREPTGEAGAAGEARTLVELSARRAAQSPGHRGYVFRPDGDEPEEELTFGELDRRARALAAALHGHVGPGDRALLHFPAGLGFLIGFFGCLYAGAIAVPAAPLEVGRSGPAAAARTRSIVASAQPAVLLTVDSYLRGLDPGLRASAGLTHLPALSVDDVASAPPGDWRGPRANPDDVAYLQYSSGSTGTPKGVVLTHRNALHNLAAIRDLFGEYPGRTGALWLPMFHDMGLVTGGLLPVFGGGRVTLMSPLSFVQRPYRWLAALSDGVAMSAAPNFAYELCASRITDRQRASLDLSGWTCAIVGAERVRAETLDRFAEAFGPCGFRRESFAPSYGLAESTLLVTSGPLQRGPTVRSFDRAALSGHTIADAREGHGGGEAVTLVGSGRPRPGLQVAIVDPDTRRPAGPDLVGEIWVSGGSVGAGYWEAPDETEATFGLTVEGSEGAFLRTGDLGAIVDGELFVTGRRKDVVIVDGFNHYAPDLEATAEAAHPSIRRGFCAVVSVDDGRRERVVVLGELAAPSVRAVTADGTGAASVQIITAVRGALSAGHGVSVDDVVLLRPGSLPFTSSGKLQRYACRDAYAAGDYAACRVRPAAGSALAVA